MPVSSFGYVNRLKLFTLPFDAKRYGPPNPNRDLLTIYMGVGLGGDGEGEEGETSEVANLLTHASRPSSSRTCSQSPFTSRIFREVPFFALPMPLKFVPVP